MTAKTLPSVYIVCRQAAKSNGKKWQQMEGTDGVSALLSARIHLCRHPQTSQMAKNFLFKKYIVQTISQATRNKLIKNSTVSINTAVLRIKHERTDFTRQNKTTLFNKMNRLHPNRLHYVTIQELDLYSHRPMHRWSSSCASLPSPSFHHA